MLRELFNACVTCGAVCLIASGAYWRERAMLPYAKKQAFLLLLVGLLSIGVALWILDILRPGA